MPAERFRLPVSILVSVFLFSLLGCGGLGVSRVAAQTPTETRDFIHGAPSQTLVQHVVIVVMQNASFDHIFGTFPPPAAGWIEGIRPGVPGYVQTDAAGKAVSPFKLTNLAPKALPEGPKSYTRIMHGGLMDKFAFYEGDISMGYYDGATPGISTLWSYAHQYAMADQFYSSVIGEAPSNQLYLIAASDANRPYSWQPFYGPCQLPDRASKPLTFANVGDQMTAAGVTWKVYIESLGNCPKYKPLHNPFQYFTSTHNKNVRDYTQFSSDLSAGHLPAVSYIFPNNADDMHPGFGPVTKGAAFLDALVKSLQASPEWNSTAVIVTFDDGGGWYDHMAPPQVDSQGLGGRVPLLVISPLAKKGYVSHTRLDHVSILRFIQNNWGLPSLNSRNSLSNDLSDLFQ